MAPSIWQLLIVLVIVLLLFGTKRLRNIGGDLGGAIRGFRSSMKGKAEDAPEAEQLAEENSAANKSSEPTEDKDKTAAS